MSKRGAFFAPVADAATTAASLIPRAAQYALEGVAYLVGKITDFVRSAGDAAAKAVEVLGEAAEELANKLDGAFS
jgi:phage tail tape-measure protein